MKAWLIEVLSEDAGADIFLVDIDWKANSNRLIAFIDSDLDLSLDRCQKISRMIEKRLDESGLIGSEYSLSVSSPGVQRPLVSRRQYPKNVGRVLRVISTDDQEVIGKLVDVDDDRLIIQPETKKGKHQKATYGAAQDIAFENIKETFVEIRF